MLSIVAQSSNPGVITCLGLWSTWYMISATRASEPISFVWWFPLHNRAYWFLCYSLRWRHDGPDGVSNHQPPDCLLNRLLRRRSKKTSKLRVTGLHRWPVNSPHKRPVTRKMFPFDDVIILHWDYCPWEDMDMDERCCVTFEFETQFGLINFSTRPATSTFTQRQVEVSFYVLKSGLLLLKSLNMTGYPIGLRKARMVIIGPFYQENVLLLTKFGFSLKFSYWVLHNTFLRKLLHAVILTDQNIIQMIEISTQ